jgi:hypothetical protein
VLCQIRSAWPAPDAGFTSTCAGSVNERSAKDSGGESGESGESGDGDGTPKGRAGGRR